jgi:hypothetical protein
MIPKQKTGKADTTYLLEYAPELERICNAFSFGENKYSRDNWRNVSIDDFHASKLRHALYLGEPDTECHEIQEIVNCLIILRKRREQQ